MQRKKPIQSQKVVENMFQMGNLKTTLQFKTQSQMAVAN